MATAMRWMTSCESPARPPCISKATSPPAEPSSVAPVYDAARVSRFWGTTDETHALGGHCRARRVAGCARTTDAAGDSIRLRARLLQASGKHVLRRVGRHCGQLEEAHLRAVARQHDGTRVRSRRNAAARVRPKREV